MQLHGAQFCGFSVLQFTTPLFQQGYSLLHVLAISDHKQLKQLTKVPLSTTQQTRRQIEISTTITLALQTERSNILVQCNANKIIAMYYLIKKTYKQRHEFNVGVRNKQGHMHSRMTSIHMDASS